MTASSPAALHEWLLSLDNQFMAAGLDYTVAVKSCKKAGKRKVYAFGHHHGGLCTHQQSGFMHTLDHACSACNAGTGGSPAFIADSTATEAVWQYMMPKEPVDSEACPKGHGSGLYFGHDNTHGIVAVVGTAHVRGIVAELEKLSALQCS